MENALSVKYAEPWEWDGCKSTIYHLYIEKDRSLKEVMDYMLREYQFRATPDMYKRKLRRWGFSKYLNTEEAVAIVRASRARRASGKRATEFIRESGVTIDYGVVKRYLARNPGVGLKCRAGSRVKSLASLQIRCRTPPPNSPPRSLRMPDDLARSEYILVAMKEFYSAYSEDVKHSMSCMYLTEEGRKTIELFELVRVGIEEGYGTSILPLLNSAFEKLHRFWPSSGPASTFYFIDAIRAFSRSTRVGLHAAESASKYICRLTSTLFGTRHPQTRIWTTISTELTILRPVELQKGLEDIARRGICLLIAKESAEDMDLWHDIALTPQGPDALQDKLRGTSSETLFVFSQGPISNQLNRYLHFCLTLAHRYVRSGEHDQAIDILWRSHMRLQSITSHCSAMGWHTVFRNSLAFVEESRGNWCAAAQHYRQAVVWAKRDDNMGYTLSSLRYLANFLQRIGKHDEAASALAELKHGVDSELVKCEPLDIGAMNVSSV